jgi:hypothetical protein
MLALSVALVPVSQAQRSQPIPGTSDDDNGDGDDDDRDDDDRDDNDFYGFIERRPSGLREYYPIPLNRSHRCTRPSRRV